MALRGGKACEAGIRHIAGGAVTARGMQRRKFQPGFRQVRLQFHRARERGHRLPVAALCGERTPEFQLDHRRAGLRRREPDEHLGRRLRVAAAATRRAEQQGRRRVAGMVLENLGRLAGGGRCITVQQCRRPHQFKIYRRACWCQRALHR